jgi:hypothetical protein
MQPKLNEKIQKNVGHFFFLIFVLKVEKPLFLKISKQIFNGWKAIWRKCCVVRVVLYVLYSTDPRCCGVVTVTPINIINVIVHRYQCSHYAFSSKWGENDWNRSQMGIFETKNLGHAPRWPQMGCGEGFEWSQGARSGSRREIEVEVGWTITINVIITYYQCS